MSPKQQNPTRKASAGRARAAAAGAQGQAVGVAARSAALAILSDVLRKRRAVDVVSEDVLARAKLEPRDAGFARAIAVETLRRFGQLEDLIRNFVPKSPPPHKAGTTMEILLAGACELLFLKVAAHAAVDGANRLAQNDSKAAHFKPLINAVLRRVSREGADLIAAQDAARLNTPDWLWRRWLEYYGEDATRQIAQVHAEIPPLDLTCKTPTAAAYFPPDAQLAPGYLRLRDAGRIDVLPGFEEGAWWVQDFAASLPARLFGDVAGKSVIDLCSAPGGKTAQLAAAGAKVTALDIAGDRLAVVRENLERLKLSADTIIADAREWRPPALADCVLLDAPCTATGTIRRHPDLPWIKSAADVPVVESLQSELLDAAAEMTAAGGTLVYAVCSLEPEEGIDQVARFLRSHPEFTRRPIAASELPDAAFLTAEGDLRTLPSHWAEKGGMDGFYAARLQRAR